MKYLLFSICCLLGGITLQAQQEYVWDAYGIGFTLADDFVEVTNDEDEFSADGDGMSFSIVPFSNEELDENDLTAYTISIFDELDITRTDAISKIRLNGFVGGYALGASDDTRLFVMGLIDPDSDTNFFVIITFFDDDHVAVEEAIRICKSLHRL
ncbi:MAG: hypothetical protein KDC49_22660 [Saprospiraceae bacterium]|nr:hypothetical protein [Saprospiraceae bacterium]